MNNDGLKKAGLKVTIPRIKILAILEENQAQHMSAEGIYQALRSQGEDMALATVYRVLAQFESAGLIVRHQFEGDHAVFELNHGEHHDHLVCVKCGRVEEFVDEVIELRQAAVAKQHNFDMTDHSLNIYGICGYCR